MGADSSKAAAAPGACPSQLWAKPSAWEPALHKDGIRGFLLVAVGSLGGVDWWRAGACRAGRGEAGWAISGRPSVRSPARRQCPGHAAIYARLSSWKRFQRAVQRPGPPRGES